MKIVSIFLVASLLVSCGTQVAFTDAIRTEFGLDNEIELRKVQFYTSATIILEKSKSQGNQNTAQDGALVTSSSKVEDRVIIPVGTKCIFDGFGPKGELMLRFETGPGKNISFAVRPNQSSSKYYLVADWSSDKGGKLNYGSEVYFATASSGSAYLNVKLKKLQKTQRKDRVVKGMKV
jgi:hypothetical protein